MPASRGVMHRRSQKPVTTNSLAFPESLCRPFDFRNENEAARVVQNKERQQN